MTADGQRVHVAINVDDPDLLEGIDPATCDGVSCRLLARAGGRPVIVRALVPAATSQLPDSPSRASAIPSWACAACACRWRGRTCFGSSCAPWPAPPPGEPLEIMLPMVTRPEELEAARALFEEELSALRAACIEAVRAPLGMMVAVVPAQRAPVNAVIAVWSPGT